MSPTIEETIINLEIIRQTLCAYGAKVNTRCDCKFGVKHIYSGKNKIFPRLSRGENGNGCAEIRVAIGYLKSLVNVEKTYLRHINDCSSCSSPKSQFCREGMILHKRLYGY